MPPNPLAKVTPSPKRLLTLFSKVVKVRNARRSGNCRFSSCTPRIPCDAAAAARFARFECPRGSYAQISLCPNSLSLSGRGRASGAGEGPNSKIRIIFCPTPAAVEIAAGHHALRGFPCVPLATGPCDAAAACALESRCRKRRIANRGCRNALIYEYQFTNTLIIVLYPILQPQFTNCVVAEVPI